MATHEDQPAAPVAELLDAAARGAERAWRDLVGLYWRRVFALARARLRDDDLAEEITQSVFVTLAETISAGRYDERGRFESWLFRVTMNRVRDQARRSSRQATRTDPAALAELVPEHDGHPLTPPDDFAALRAALERLPDADREVIELRHHAGLAFNEMAAVLEEPVGTLLARHHRALRKLRAMLEQSSRGSGRDQESQEKREEPKQRKAAG